MIMSKDEIELSAQEQEQDERANSSDRIPSAEGDRLVDSHDLAHPGEKPADIRDPESKTQRPEK
jgi:hypothetical protein